MSKRKTKHIWLRFEVLDTPKAMSEFQRAADKLFNARSVESRGQYTDAEVLLLAANVLTPDRRHAPRASTALQDISPWQTSTAPAPKAPAWRSTARTPACRTL